MLFRARTDLCIGVLLGVGAPDRVHSSWVGVRGGGVRWDGPCAGRAGHFEGSAWSIAWRGRKTAHISAVSSGTK